MYARRQHGQSLLAADCLNCSTDLAHQGHRGSMTRAGVPSDSRQQPWHIERQLGRQMQLLQMRLSQMHLHCMPTPAFMMNGDAASLAVVPPGMHAKLRQHACAAHIWQTTTAIHDPYPCLLPWDCKRCI